MRNILRLIAAILILNVAVTGTVFAENSDNMHSHIEHKAVAGEIIKDQLTIVNTAEYAVQVKVRKGDVTDEHEGALVETIEADPTLFENRLDEWISLHKNTFEVEAGGKLVIPYEIRIPRDAKAEITYGSIFVQTGPIGAIYDENSREFSLSHEHCMVVQVGDVMVIRDQSIRGSAEEADPPRILDVALAILAIFAFATGLSYVGKYGVDYCAARMHASNKKGAKHIAEKHEKKNN